ncbi:carbon catabolite repressor protein 4 3 [Cinnamomum micranthum f. kanehirae]|uniref:Carbon catabolite repressor protein 4 3 n=1 Tax=Cinnamomum micranthum f. kanehirae TaxID=337451 RepID=A0A3S3PWR8_9MAGN|nr:carbon catabolite repressor protein 4 3 [Cinnamomum micranthum f. kanehirae]
MECCFFVALQLLGALSHGFLCVLQVQAPLLLHRYYPSHRFPEEKLPSSRLNSSLDPIHHPFSLSIPFPKQMRKDYSRRLLVGNIHVLFNPNRGDIKLGQIRLLLQKAHALSEKWGSIPVVLAGDFNSTPQSAIYKFLSSSELNLTMHDKRQLSGQNQLPACSISWHAKADEEAIFFSGQASSRFVRYCWTDEELITATGNSKYTKLKHRLKLKSSYPTLKGNARTRDRRGEPLATTYHSKFLGTVDYLWFTDGLTPTKVLDTLPVGILRSTGGLPSKKCGSDHLALVSEFAFVQSSRDEEQQQYTCTEIAVNTASVEEEAK